MQGAEQKPQTVILGPPSGVLHLGERSPHPAGVVVDLLAVLKADNDHIDRSEPQHEPEGVVDLLVVLGILTAANELHTDDAFAGIVQLVDQGNDFLRFAFVHGYAVRVDPGVQHIDPGAFHSSFHGLPGVN